MVLPWGGVVLPWHRQNPASAQMMHAASVDQHHNAEMMANVWLP